MQCNCYWYRRFCFYLSLRDEIVFQDIEKENQYSPKMFFFFLNENILQRMIAHSVAQQSSFTYGCTYTYHTLLVVTWVACGYLREKKPNLLIRVILSDIT